jgi:alkanesulfonate monooxygenase SsuD/methylene tetrahydromethanopterin reductase-like flavin-dependent oxidoreductase (luciferase family)
MNATLTIAPPEEQRRLPRVRFGLALDLWSATGRLPDVLDRAAELLKLAERYEFESVWAGEHRPAAPFSFHTPAPLLVLAALANRTRLRLGTGVTLLTLWHPLQLAYESALLDQLSGGRLTLGVGVGTSALMSRYGVAPDEAGSRMDEALDVLKTLWAGGTTFDGHHWHIDGAVYPGPVQEGGPPVWVGGKLRRSVRRAAVYGDAWYAATPYHLGIIARQARRYRDELERAGKRADDAIVAINRATFLAETDGEARRQGEPYLRHVLDFYGRVGGIWDADGNALDPKTDLFSDLGVEVYFCGSPQLCIEAVDRYHVEGRVNYVNFRVSMGDMPQRLVERTVTLLGEQVIPAFSASN